MKPTFIRFRPSALHIAIQMTCTVVTAVAFTHTQAEDQVQQLPTITVKANESSSTYTEKSSRAATKLNLDLKDTPQSVTVFTQQQIQDQNLLSTHDVLNQTPGVSVIQYGQQGAGYTTYSARGFKINNVQRDGIPSSVESFGGNDMLGLEDSALYERIEVIRGSTGLTTGSGNPSASINYVRKRPTAEIKGAVNIQAGSWNNYRSQFDVSGALNQDESIRGRFIAAYAEGESNQDRFEKQNAVVYGALDFDLSEKTTLTGALTLQQVKIDDATAHGFPFVSSDKTPQVVHFDRDDNPAADWTYSDTEKLNLFLGLEHQFNPNWKGVMNYAYTHAENDRVYGVAGSGALVYQDEIKNNNYQLKAGEMVVTGGRFVNTPDVHAVDLYLSGQFDAWGQQHDISFGVNGYRVKSDDPKFTRVFTPTKIEAWNGHVVKPEIKENGRNIIDEYQLGAFATAKLQLLDPLKLIIGGRVSTWERDVTGLEQKEDAIITPYFGLIFDLTAQISAYSSYTSIFQPSSNKNIAGDYLDPEEGNSIEVGLKGAFFGDRLNASAAYFELEQDNAAVKDGVNLTPEGGQAYLAVDGAEVNGYDFTVAGELLPNWNIQAGYTYTKATDAKGDVLDPSVPKQLVKLFTSYQWNDLMLGGGVNWQSEIHEKGAQGLKAEYNKQDAYYLVNLMARYHVRPDLSIGLNINNLLDEEYKVNVSNSWGTARNMTASMNFKF